MINLKKGAPLRALPMRITELQWTRLNAARDRDDIAIQEHVRRALDAYLDTLDRKWAKLAPVNSEGLTVEEQAKKIMGALQSPNVEDKVAAIQGIPPSARQPLPEMPVRRKVVYR